MASAESGIGRIDDPAALRVSMRVYDRAAGLSSNEVWCFAEDRKGRIYAGTARGVDRLDPESGEITHWTQADGLSGGGIRSALASRNGDLWFLSNSGLSRMPGRGEDAAAAPLAARIMAVRVGGAPQPVSDNGETEVAAAEFPWYQNSVEIDFAAIDFLTPEQLRFQFRLEGGRARWSDPTPNSTVHFSNLAPGRYRFLVRAAAPDGHASGSPAQFAFAIAPPWWKRGWFVALSGALVAVLAFLLHRSSLHRQLALERVRSRIATDLHDDLGASLARIAVFSEAILTRASVGDAVSRRMLGEIADTSRAVVEAMSDIVWSIDPRRDSVGDLVARLRAFGSDLLESQGISWTCEETTAAGLRQALSPDQRREMFLIFKEAIHNIARHSRARAVSLRVEVGRHAVSGEIQDDGIGFAQAADAGLGLASMRARAARLGGELQIGPGPGSGTRIRLRFPLKQRHA
jgi:signal transduction histidine kinase